MPDLILHNYPQSPVAEKIRVAFGIKNLSWHSVEIPRVPPKPMLTALTGGYRRTPVMQIGADIYCDSQCILRELENRFPSPTFFPTSDAGLIWSLGRWTDGALFDLGVKMVLGAANDDLPPDFAADRGRLYLGPDWAKDLKAAHNDLPHMAAQMRTQMHWLNSQLSDGRKYLLGSEPAAIDTQFYYVVWFLRGRWAQGPAFLAEFPYIATWENNVAHIGHGQVNELSAQDAHDQARKSEPLALPHSDENDPQGLVHGTKVVISPDLDGGELPTLGTLVCATAETVVIARTDTQFGTIHVHFPRLGYRVSTQD